MSMQVVLAQIYKMGTHLPALHTEVSIDQYTTTVRVDTIVLVAVLDFVGLMVPGHQDLQCV